MRNSPAKHEVFVEVTPYGGFPEIHRSVLSPGIAILWKQSGVTIVVCTIFLWTFCRMSKSNPRENYFTRFFLKSYMMIIPKNIEQDFTIILVLLRNVFLYLVGACCVVNVPRSGKHRLSNRRHPLHDIASMLTYAVNQYKSYNLMHVIVCLVYGMHIDDCREHMLIFLQLYSYYMCLFVLIFGVFNLVMAINKLNK